MRGVCGGVRGVCMCGVGVGVAWDVRGVGMGRKERVSLAPLYYPDTLVNPDTCLGNFCSYLLMMFDLC